MTASHSSCGSFPARSTVSQACANESVPIQKFIRMIPERSLHRCNFTAMLAAEQQSALASGDLDIERQHQYGANAIYDVTEVCSDIFERLISAVDRDSLPKGTSITSDTSESSYEEQTRNISSLRNSLAFWIDYTGALAPVGASLDDRLHEHGGVQEMVVELLEMVERNLRRCKHPALPSQLGAAAHCYFHGHSGTK